MKRLQAMITQKCNSNCQYCMVARCGKEMTNEVIQNIPAIAETNSCDTLLLFGGEPLLREDVCINIANRFNGKVILPTNGILLKEYHLDLFDNILISTNGTEETCKITGQVYVPHIKNIQKKDKCTIGMRLIPDSVKRMKIDFKYLYDMGFRKYNIAPITEMNWSDEDLETYKDGVKYITSIIDRDAIWTWRRGGICVPYEGTTCLDTEGKTWACARFLEEQIEIPKKINERYFTFCLKCDLMPYCFHNCNYLNFKKNGSLYYPYKTICKFAKLYKEVFE